MDRVHRYRDGRKSSLGFSVLVFIAMIKIFSFIISVVLSGLLFISGGRVGGCFLWEASHLEELGQEPAGQPERGPGLCRHQQKRVLRSHQSHPPRSSHYYTY